MMRVYSLQFTVYGLLLLLLSSCYRERTPSRFQLSDTLIVADTLTQAQQDSLNFVHTHHYSENFNFVVRKDSIVLLRQQPEELLSGMPTDSFAVKKDTRMVVADIRIIPTDSIDSVWVNLATENMDFGWSREHSLLDGVDPDDPISQFIMLFSNIHLLIFLVVFGLMAVGYLMRKLLKRGARIVHFNDINTFYPVALALIVAAAATFYASIQLFAPDAWHHFYFHPSLNPFSQPILLALFLSTVWTMLIVAIAAVDDTLHLLKFDDAVLYLLGLAAVCAFNYIVFSISTLYFIGYPLYIIYVWFAIRLWKRQNPNK
ncbi:MAG: zinc ribbon domain-containing protein [Prevotella sp.]|nr:zinc ribbon domain-containing protein [Prevotella sp.]